MRPELWDAKTLLTQCTHVITFLSRVFGTARRDVVVHVDGHFRVLVFPDVKKRKFDALHLHDHLTAL